MQARLFYIFPELLQVYFQAHKKKQKYDSDICQKIKERPCVGSKNPVLCLQNPYHHSSNYLTDYSWKLEEFEQFRHQVRKNKSDKNNKQYIFPSNNIR